MKVDEYRDYYGKQYVDRFGGVGWTSIEVLNFLWGRKLCDEMLCYIHALKPTALRITRGIVSLDCCSGRVTVHVDENDIVEKIEQEVEVGLFDEISCGHDLDQFFRSDDNDRAR